MHQVSFPEYNFLCPLCKTVKFFSFLGDGNLTILPRLVLNYWAQVIPLLLPPQCWNYRHMLPLQLNCVLLRTYSFFVYKKSIHSFTWQAPCQMPWTQRLDMVTLFTEFIVIQILCGKSSYRCLSR
jgi:hypothetical protein